MKQTQEDRKKHNFGPNFGQFSPNLGPQKFLSSILLLLVAIHWSKLSPHAIYMKTHEPNLRKW